MKLSEAMLKGCEMVPRQIERAFMDGCEMRAPTGACAIGAAIVGRLGFPISFEACLDEASLIQRELYIASGRDLYHRILARNDSGESRESIAAWLAKMGL